LPAASAIADQAPPFTGGASQGKNISLASLRGKPVVLVISPDPRSRDFRRQLSELRGRYERLAAKGTIFFAGFTSGDGVIGSNIPFLLLNNPSGTAGAYDLPQGFAIAVIGVDGNLDCLSTKPLPGQRILDIINNNASVQEKLRR
jgi:hypothetical protein